MSCINNCGLACCEEPAYRSERRCCICTKIVQVNWFCQVSFCMMEPEGPDVSERWLQICAGENLQDLAVCILCVPKLTSIHRYGVSFRVADKFDMIRFPMIKK